jgi:uncharacterized protein (DUF2461 family)
MNTKSQETHARAALQGLNPMSQYAKVPVSKTKKAKLERAVSGKLENDCNSKAWTTSFYIALGLAEALCVCVCVFTALFHPNFEREI